MADREPLLFERDLKRLDDAAAPAHASLMIAFSNVAEISDGIIQAAVRDLDRIGRTLRER